MLLCLGVCWFDCSISQHYGASTHPDSHWPLVCRYQRGYCNYRKTKAVLYNCTRGTTIAACSILCIQYELSKGAPDILHILGVCDIGKTANQENAMQFRNLYYIYPFKIAEKLKYHASTCILCTHCTVVVCWSCVIWIIILNCTSLKQAMPIFKL